MSRSLRSNKKGPFSSSNDDVDTFYPTTSSNNSTRPTRRKSKIEVQESVPAPTAVAKARTRARSKTREMNTVDVDTNEKEEFIPVQSNSTSSSSSTFMKGNKYQKHDQQQSNDNFENLSLPDNVTPLPSDDIKPVSFNSLLTKNISLLLGLTLFGTGTMILFTQIEKNSPLKLFLQSSFLSFQKTESYKIHLKQLEIFQQLSAVQHHHFSFAIGILGLLFILTGGYFYFISKKDELQRQMDMEKEKKGIKNNLKRSITKSATTAIKPSDSHSNIANTATNIFNIATAAASVGATSTSTGSHTSIISDNTAIFLQQIEIYKQQLKEQSLHFNLMAFLERMKVKWFRIVCILVIMLMFYGIKILYIHREFVILYIQSGGVLITKVFVALVSLILFIYSIIYYFRARRRHYKLISFFANVIKNRLAIYNGAEYPIDFMEEDVRDFVTSYDQQRQQDEQKLKSQSAVGSSSSSSSSSSSNNATLDSSDNSTNNNMIASTDNTNNTTTHNHASFLLSPTARLTSWDGFSPTPASHSSSSLSQSHAASAANKSINPVNIQLSSSTASSSLIPEDIAVRLKPYMVKIYWKQIQNEVNKDKRVQIVTVLYHGMNRKCWRRLDLIPRVSTAQKHSSSTSNISSGVSATSNYTINMKTNPNHHNNNVTTSNIASRLTGLNSINPNTNTNNTNATPRQTSITTNTNEDANDDPYDHDWAQSIVGRQSTTTGTPYVKGTTTSASSTSKYSNVARTGF